MDRFSTGGITGGSALIHDFYSREGPNPVHLTVDTEFRSGGPSIKAYVSVTLSLGELQLAAQFQEIPLDLRMVEAERIGCMYIYLSLYFNRIHAICDGLLMLMCYIYAYDTEHVHITMSSFCIK